MLEDLLRLIQSMAGLPPEERIAAYNAATRALRALVADVCDAPALAPQLVPAAAVEANGYNPNHVAHPEMDLLEQSIRCDGVTMPIVTYPDPGQRRWIVVDGYHRRTVLAERLGWRYLPCSEIDRPVGDRMAATIRHNRARGKHQVDLMATIVRELMDLGWDDARIAEHVGMTPEELLRLRQMTGAARWLAAPHYGIAYGRDDEPPETP